ncbi:hypothetical protein FIBSPDRAFT_942656 [Athelia psychrophila]|uniref:THO1-MOS11 C-terminal domain-containing protein n=1 Tax=Athelia psychrophila TaxID=1759441 RepID=A0A166X962_9AGAM|nr:hypothetical protein FIBSPDRAFT_942656 [Fibularhizoctonia sp. CBS 109695]
MSEAKLKSLKVAELKDILAKAAVSVPAKANKQDLIKLVSASPAALDVYTKQQNPNAAPSSTTTTDDLLAPPEDFDWDGDATDAHASKEPTVTKEAPAVEAKPAKPASKATAKAPVSPKKSAQAAQEVAAEVTASTTEPAADTTADEELEKRRKRAERFGVPLVETPKPAPPAAKKAGRNAAQPKSTPISAAPNDPETLNARAARFGTATAPNAAASKKRPVEEIADPEELERRKKRAERFGIPAAST